MKRFVFRLARLERLRLIERRQARAALASTLGEEHQARCARDAAHAGLDEAWTTEPADEARCEPHVLQALAAWREGCRTVLTAAGGRLEQAGAATKEAFELHAEAARNHRALERLHETRRDRWLAEQRLEEGKFLDEIHQLRVARERGGTEALTCDR